MRRYHFLILIHLFFFPLEQISAQEYKINVQQFGVEDGLAHRHVWSVFKDKAGFLWIAYENDLQRFDGYEFKNYQLPDWIWTIQQIEEGEDGWLGLMNLVEKRILFFNPLSGEMKSAAEKWGKDLAAKFEELTSQTNNIYWQGDFIYLLHAEGLSAINWQTGAMDFQISATVWNKKEVHEIHLVDDQQNIWLSNETEKFVLHPQKNLNEYQLSKKAQKLPLQELFNWNNQVWAISKNENSSSQLFKLKENGEVAAIFEAPKGFNIHQFLEGQIWCIGNSSWQIYDVNGNLLAKLNPENFNEKQLDASSLNLLKAGPNKFFLPSAYGLSILEFQKNTFTQYFSENKNQPLPFKNSARGIFVEQDSIIVVFEFGGTVLFRKNQPKDFEILVSQLEHPITKEKGVFGGRVIFRDSKQYYWGDMAAYFYRWDSDFSAPQKIPFKSKVPYTHGEIWSIFEDKQGCFWLSYPSMLGKICEGETEFITYDYTEKEFGYDPGRIYQIQELEDGLLWICSSNGLFVFNKEKEMVQAHYHKNGEGEYQLPVNNLFFMHTDSDGNRWLATQSGLLYWNPKTHKKRLFTENDGLSNNVIYAVYEDDFNRLWLSSDYGIMSFNKNSFEINTYLPKDGVAQEEFNRISHFQDEEGTIYFGGLNGVTAFHPKDFVEEEKDFAKLVISDFEIFDGEAGKLVNKFVEITKNQMITFRPADRFFRLKFSLPTFEDVRQILYAWKIEGLDSDWNFQKENSIQIGVLPYGNHILKIKAQNGSGWSPHELAIRVNVLKPFYLQIWFIGLSIIALILSVLYILKRRTRKFKEAQKLLETEIQKATAQIEEDKKIIEKQADELRQLDKLKSRFFANVAHELRTPLTLMLGPISSALKSGQLDNRTFTLLKKAQTGGKDLLKLVSSILGLSKMEAGKMELQEQPELIFPLLRRLVSDFESHAEREGIQFVFQYHGEQNLQLLLDAEKLKIILNNLLSNALKFTPKGKEIWVEIWVEDSLLKMMIKDTGRGIHPNDLPNIFNRFYQSSQVDAPTEGGTGIGLALTQELIHLMKGEIWVESELGEGSAFYFKIPRKEVLGTAAQYPDFPKSGKSNLAGSSATSTRHPDLGKSGYKAVENPPEVTSLREGREDWQKGVISEENSEPKEMTPSSRALSPTLEDVTSKKHSPTVLIVEDNSALRNYLETILSPYYNIQTAENGKVGLEMLTNPQPVTRNPQLILSDIMMPVMDGFQLLKELKSSDEFRHIPVIMLTARADIQDKLRALRIGVDDYILKPFEEEELLVRIENLLQNYQLRIEQLSDSSQVSDNLTTNTPTISNEDQEWLTELEKQLQQHISNSQYSITQLANDMAISERQLRRRIKQLIGLTPVQYFKSVRLQYARQLLEEKTYKTVAQVAAAVGFQSPKAFSRVFTKQFGKSPFDYLV